MENLNAINITPIIQALITLLTVIITTFVIPWIKAKMTKEQYNTLKLWCKTAVNAAEQLYVGSGIGADKLTYALNKVTNMVNNAGYRFSQDEIRATIEEAVHDMKHSV